MNLPDIYHSAIVASDYRTFLILLGQKIGILETDARSKDITLQDLCNNDLCNEVIPVLEELIRINLIEVDDEGEVMAGIMEETEIWMDAGKLLIKLKTMNESNKDQLKKDIVGAYTFLRENNYNIPDQSLDFIKTAALEKLEGKVLPDDVKNVLLKVMKAYQGVGDFEGTGENMVLVICDVVHVLTDYNIDYKDDPK